MLILMLVLSCADTPPDEPLVVGDGGGASDDGGADGGGEEVTGFVPDSFTIYGVLGIDATGGTLHGWSEGDAEYTPWVAVRIFDADQVEECDFYFNIGDPESVSLEHWGFEDATPEADGQLMDHWGFFVPDSATYGVSETCAEWNADFFGEIQDVVPDHDWGFGVGDLRVDIQDVVLSDTWADSAAADHLAAGELIGGSWSTDMWEPSTFASHIATGSPADDWRLEVDADGVPTTYFVSADYDAAAGSLPDGVYVLNSVYLWDFGTYFDRR